MASFVSIYARALNDVVVARKLDANRISTDFEAISTMLAENEQLRIVWESPAVPAEQKLKVLDAIAGRLALLPEIRNFVAVLITKRRIHAFKEIAKEAMHHINNALGIADAEIVSARELSADEKRKVEAQVAAATGRLLRARYALDPKLIGGAMVKVGSTIYDGSIRGQLERMREKLAGI
jgi:F-type H+-transporting ATPase subunit delta